MANSCRIVFSKWTTWPQWLATFEVSLLGLSFGLAGGWTSPFLAKLTQPGSELPVALDEASWIASLTPMGRVAGAILGSIEVAYLGSKFSLLTTGLPLAVSWVCLIVANSVVWIYVARILQGICMGMLFSTFPLYAGEVSNPRIRGAIITVIMISQGIGFIAGNLMGTFTSMWLFSAISLVSTLAFLVLFSLLPASPHYLVSQNRLDEAGKALVWYQRDADVKNELESLKNFVYANDSLTIRQVLHELSMPVNRNALISVTMIFVLLQVGGTYVVEYYTEIILRRAGVGTVIDPGLGVVGIGVCGIAGGLLAIYGNDNCGRKVVLCGSCAGLTVGFGLLGLQYVLLEQGYASPSLEWLPIGALIGITFFINLGIGPVPSTIVSEIFSPSTKTIASCVANLSSGAFSFINTKTYQVMIDAMPDQYVMWFYGLAMAALGVYTAVKIPETKGKSLQEIQEMIQKKNPANSI